MFGHRGNPIFVYFIPKFVVRLPLILLMGVFLKNWNYFVYPLQMLGEAGSATKELSKADYFRKDGGVIKAMAPDFAQQTALASYHKVLQDTPNTSPTHIQASIGAATIYSGRMQYNDSIPLWTVAAKDKDWRGRPHQWIVNALKTDQCCQSVGNCTDAVKKLECHPND